MAPTTAEEPMTLQGRLQAIRDGLSNKAPQASAALHGFIEELRATGIEDRVLRVGARAPGFELQEAHGTRMSLDDLIARGPVILTFYRGRR
jgi:hypothetical protein